MENKKKIKKRKKGFWTCIKVCLYITMTFRLSTSQMWNEGLCFKGLASQASYWWGRRCAPKSVDWIPAFSLQVISYLINSFWLHDSAGKTNVSGITANQVPQTHMLSKCACFYKVEKLWLIGIALDFKVHFISLMNFKVSPAVTVL